MTRFQTPKRKCVVCLQGAYFTRLAQGIRNLRTGPGGGIGEGRTLGFGLTGRGGGVWRNIVKSGEEIDGLGFEFTSSWGGVLGYGREILFWVDRWIDNRRLCDRFPRLYHLDRRK